MPGIRTISRKQIIGWGWAPTQGTVFYNRGTRRESFVARIKYLWGFAKKGRKSELWANEKWIYIRRGKKEYRTLLHPETKVKENPGLTCAGCGKAISGAYEAGSYTCSGCGAGVEVNPEKTMIKVGDTVMVQEGRFVGHSGIVNHVGFDGCPEHGNCKGYIKITFTSGGMVGKNNTFKASKLRTEEQRANLFKLIGQSFADEHKKAEEDEEDEENS